MSESIKQLRADLISLIKEEPNPDRLLRTIDVLQRDRKDIPLYNKIKKYAKAGGNVGFFFKTLDDCKIYSPLLIQKLLQRNTSSRYYHIYGFAKKRLEGSNSDITKRNMHYKLAILLSHLLKLEKLPFKDIDGNPIPIMVSKSSEKRIIDDPLKLLNEMIAELDFGKG